ncbi:MAG: trimethylamine methyltransferase family protein [Caldilinea sp.]
MDTPIRRTRRDQRRAPHATAEVARIVQPLHELPVYNLVDEERVAQIHDKSMQILEQAGIAFFDEESLQILRDNGAKVVGDMAYFDRELVGEFLKHVPHQFTLQARNPGNNVVIGGDHMTFLPVYGPPFVRNRARGRREATLADLQNFIKLTMMTPYLHHQGGVIVEPMDLPFHTRHMDIVYAHIKFGDRGFMGASTEGYTAADSIAMSRILFGEQMNQPDPCIFCTINVSSPRRLDDKMLGTIKQFARARQGVMMTPFILAGAMGPAAIAGTVAQLNAEALAGIVFTQMVNPGTPCIYGSFLAVVDLRSGAPVFGAPESQLSLYLSAQMARHYGLPFRSAGMYASAKTPDAQSAYESVMAMLPGVMAKVNLVLHAAGWLENGLVADYEKFVLDCEILGMVHTYLKGVDWSEEGWAMESILHEVSPGGHHLGTAHTMRHYRNAFYHAELFDYQAAEAWEAGGALSSEVRAAQKVAKLLYDYERPPLDPAIDDELQEFMERRKRELGDTIR